MPCTAQTIRLYFCFRWLRLITMQSLASLSPPPSLRVGDRCYTSGLFTEMIVVIACHDSGLLDDKKTIECYKLRSRKVTNVTTKLHLRSMEITQSGPRDKFKLEQNYWRLDKLYNQSAKQANKLELLDQCPIRRCFSWTNS